MKVIVALNLIKFLKAFYNAYFARKVLIMVHKTQRFSLRVSRQSIKHCFERKFPADEVLVEEKKFENLKIRKHKSIFSTCF